MKSDKKAADVLPTSPEFRQPLAPELCGHVGFIIGKTRQELVVRIEALISPLTVKHFGSLMVLSSRGAMNQTELADTLRLDRTTMMNIVDELEGAGYARRGADPDDRRAHAVKITAKGKQWLDKVRPPAEAIESSFLAPLTKGEQETLRQLLLRLVTHPGDAS